MRVATDRCSVAVAIEQLAILVHDRLGEFVDHVGRGRGMHPADVMVEALVDEELSPGCRAIDVEASVAGHLQLGAKEERGMRIDPEQRMAVGGELGRNGDAVGAGRFDPARWRVDARHRLACPAVERLQFVERYALDIAADAAFAEAQRHPRFEMHDDARMHLGMGSEVVVQTIGPGIHQGLQPAGTLGVKLLEFHRVDEQPLAQVRPDRRLALGLGQPAQRVKVIGLHPIEVILGLRIGHAEHRVGVGLAVDVRDAPVVASDRDGLRLALPARFVGRVRLCRGYQAQGKQGGDR